MWLKICDLLDRLIVIENGEITFVQIPHEVSPAIGHREYQVHLLYFLADGEQRGTESFRIAGQLRGTNESRETQDE